MKYELSAELRNALIQCVANASHRATYLEVNNIIQALQQLPEIKHELPDNSGTEN